MLASLALLCACQRWFLDLICVAWHSRGACAVGCAPFGSFFLFFWHGQIYALDALAFSRATRDTTVARVIAVHVVRSAHNMIRSHSARVSRLSLWRIFLTRFRKLARDSSRERSLLLRLSLAARPPALAS